MSTPKPDTVGNVVVQKPRSNVYTMLLILTLIAIITACVLLFLELQSYDAYPWPPWKAG